MKQQTASVSQSSSSPTDDVLYRSTTAFFSINMKSDGTLICRSFVSTRSTGVKIQKVTVSGWHVYVCVLDLHDGIFSYYDGVFEASGNAASTKTAEWATLDGTIDRVKVAEITGTAVMEVSQAYVFARALDGAEVLALYNAMNAIQSQPGCGPPVTRPYCGMFPGCHSMRNRYACRWISISASICAYVSLRTSTSTISDV